MDIFVLGYAGLSGSLEIYRLKKEDIEKRYPERFLRGLTGITENKGKIEDGLCDLLCEAERKGLISDMEEALEGGVLAALWRLLERNRAGCEYSRRAIPVKQQTVEICETFGVDPLKLSSEHCFVCLCENARETEAFFGEILKESGFSYIGRTVKGKARKRTDGADTAFLRRPEPDELFKIKTDSTGPAEGR